MEQVFQALIDRSRVRLDLKTVKTILGCKRRPKYRSRKKRAAEWEVAVERPTYDLTIFKLHCGSLTLKIYSKGERVLRIESSSITRASWAAVARWRTSPRSSADCRLCWSDLPMPSAASTHASSRIRHLSVCRRHPVSVRS